MWLEVMVYKITSENTVTCELSNMNHCRPKSTFLLNSNKIFEGISASVFVLKSNVEGVCCMQYGALEYSTTSLYVLMASSLCIVWALRIWWNTMVSNSDLGPFATSSCLLSANCLLFGMFA